MNTAQNQSHLKTIVLFEERYERIANNTFIELALNDKVKGIVKQLIVKTSQASSLKISLSSADNEVELDDTAFNLQFDANRSLWTGKLDLHFEASNKLTIKPTAGELFVVYKKIYFE
jgi:hypothetical protein